MVRSNVLILNQNEVAQINALFHNRCWHISGSRENALEAKRKEGRGMNDWKIELGQGERERERERGRERERRWDNTIWGLDTKV